MRFDLRQWYRGGDWSWVGPYSSIEAARDAAVRRLLGCPSMTRVELFDVGAVPWSCGAPCLETIDRAGLVAYEVAI